MPNPGLLAQLLARDPRKLARFPDLPIDEALAELREFERRAASAAAEGTPLQMAVASAAPFSAPSALAAIPPRAAVAAEPAPPAPDVTETLGAALSSLATQVWRTRIKMVDAASGEPREEMRRVYRHVEGALENLAQMGLTLKDWLNQPYDPGLPVKVLTFQPTAGLTRDTVVEAVRPTVIWNDKLLQLGEVVVGIPPTSETSPS